jgi:hypothetical protein
LPPHNFKPSSNNSEFLTQFKQRSPLLILRIHLLISYPPSKLFTFRAGINSEPLSILAASKNTPTMPLHFSTDSPEDVAKALSSNPTKPAYLVVYASAVDGRMWCGDCRDAEPFVNAKFGDSGETATVVYAGSKPEYVSITSFPSFSLD